MCEFTMAVPKRKTSYSKKNMRRSHLGIVDKNIIFDKESGEPRLSHIIDKTTGMYKGRQIFKNKSKENK